MCIPNTDAHEGPEHKVLHEHADKGERHTVHSHQQVRYSQVEEVHVGDGSHLLVSDQRENHQGIPDDGQKKDGGVRGDKPGADVTPRVVVRHTLLHVVLPGNIGNSRLKISRGLVGGVVALVAGFHDQRIAHDASVVC